MPPRWIVLLVLLLLPLVAGCRAQPPPTMRVINGKAQPSRYVSPNAYEHYVRYQVALDRGHLQKAVTELQQALIFDARSPYLNTLLAGLLARYKLYDEAHEYLAKALEYRPGYPDALLMQAKLYWHQQQRAKAEAILSGCVRTSPGFAGCYLTYAELLDRAGQPRRARKVLAKMVRRARRPADGHSRLALLCLRLVDYTCAARHLELALRGRWEIKTLLRLAHVHRAGGNRQRTIRLLREAFDRSGGDARVAALLLEVMRHGGQQQQVDDLLLVLRKAAADRPEQLPGVAALHLSAGRAAAARAMLAPAAGKGAVALQLLYADALARLGQEQQARALLVKLQAGPHDEGATLQLVTILARRKAHAEAAKLLQAALKRHPKSPALALALARALYLSGQPRAAATVMQAAHQHHPGNKQLTFGLALALERDARWRDGVDLMRRFLLRNPKDGPAHNFVGYSMLVHGEDLDAAERYIRKALVLDPGQGYIIDSLGWLYHRRGRKTQALQLLQMAARLAPEEAEVLEHLAEAHAAQQHTATAIQLMRKAARVAHDPAVSKRLKLRIDQLERGMVGSRTRNKKQRTKNEPGD